MARAGARALVEEPQAPPAVPRQTALPSPAAPAAHLPSNDPALQQLHGALADDPAARLTAIAAELQGCERCKLCMGRNTIVVGEGNPKAELVFVGEGPGEQEDRAGRPFVGRAGELLDKMIVAMGLSREQVYIANVVKCRPPGNRNPEPDEIAACSPFLLRQLDAIRPKVIVALGKFAAQTLLRTDTPISRLRGEFHSYRGTKLMPTFHPAYLLRSPEYKREAWADLQTVARELGIDLAAKRPKG